MRPRAKQKERKTAFQTSSFPVEAIYGPEDVADLDPERDLGFPGIYPFVRGVQPTMYRGRLWTMRQYAGLRVGRGDEPALPLPARAGPDGALRRLRPADADGVRLDRRRSSEGEVGKVGVAIDSLEDMEALFDGIPLDKVTTSMTINATGGDPAPDVRGGRGAPGGRRRGTRRHDPERHPQGVRGARHLHLPPGAVAAADDRLLRVLLEAPPPLEPDLDQRLPHPRGRGDGGAGTGLHVRQRPRLRRGGGRARARRRRIRTAALLLLQRAQPPLRGGGEVPRGAAGSGPARCARSSARRIRRAGCCGSTPRRPGAP